MTRVALLHPLPENIRELTSALIACVQDAKSFDEIRGVIGKAGFTAVFLTPKPEHLRHLEDLNDPHYVSLVKALPEGREIVDYLVSLHIKARK
jgi:hypothetical protein